MIIKIKYDPSILPDPTPLITAEERVKDDLSSEWSDSTTFVVVSSFASVNNALTWVTEA